MVRKIMSLLFSLLIIAVIVISCATGNNNADIKVPTFDSLATPSDSSTFYFLAKKLRQDTTNNALDSFVCTWYSRMLFALKEPVLFNYKGDKEIYRFTWLRTFHHPVAIRMEKQANIVLLFAKVCNGAGGYEPGKIILDTTITLTSNEWATFKNKIEVGNFWTMPTEIRLDNGEDGSEWVIEAVKDNTYHLVTRWTPSNKREQRYREIGEYLVALSKLNVETRNFY